MTYPEVIQFLSGLRLFRVKQGLEKTFKLPTLAGNRNKKLQMPAGERNAADALR